MRRIGLTQFLIEQQREQRISADLRLLIEVVARAVKAISVAVGKGALADVLGEAGSDNVQGEAQKKLDVIANEILLEANEWGGHLAAMASEEMDDPHVIPSDYPKGGYLLLFDPLDGSSNIDVNVSVGTIFSVLRCPDNAQNPADAVHILQPARRSWRRATRCMAHPPCSCLRWATACTPSPWTGDGQLRHDPEPPAHSRGHREYAINASNAAGGRRRCAATWRNWRRVKAARGSATSTCAGWAPWWRMCIASSPAAASSCIPGTARIPPSPASCG